ncbi:MULTISPECIES: DUF3352 domain-containing protein [unclassified Coleofasciculus]|uniref:DUF3352 domain-containing protein n=1 Tax=Cyanophyceae TaxID=3028117 RepID=UPI001686ABBE|nr:MULTISPECIES: DUF3352 domain-containing protein [unclassified Coleofasciculus]MBD1889639.1 DUF3352 domain-containing protein [Coleofasciculus sp. FACHB-SPT9]MBD1896711.1 DUF3352 domain-containing protein [Coleofasciculus sp. FACHB-129]
MKRRSFFYVLAAGVLVLLLIGAGGFYWLRANSPLALLGGGEVTNPSATIFVPKKAPVMVSLLVNPDRLEGLRQAVARPANRKRSRAELNQFKQSLLANTDLDYRRDIQPWLGDEITLALTSLDIDRTRDNGEQRGLLLAVTTKNPQRSREFVDLFWQKQANVETDLVFETYKGVKLIYKNQESVVKTQDAGNKGFYNRDRSALPKDAINRASAQNSVATAVVGDRFVLFANNPRVLKEAINNVQAPNLSLSDSTSYQRAIESISQPKIGLTYVNLPALAKLLGNNSQMEIDPTYESLAIAISPKTQGLLAETALLAATGQEIPPTTPSLSQPVGALQYLPEKIAIAASGSNLEQLWTQLTSGLDSDDSLVQLIDQPIANLQARWGIDLKQDIFSWVQGEYALGMLPRADRKDSDWIFVAEKSATTKAEAAIDRLDAVAKQQGLSVSSFTLENQPISAWTQLTTTADKNQGEDQDSVKLEAQVKGVHASIGKYEIFTTSIEAMNQAIKAPDNSLVKSDRFQANITSLPQPNNGYLYLDWASSQAFLERQLPIVRVVELVAKPLFNELNSLAFSSYGSDDGVRRSKVFLRLGAKAEE